MKQEPDLPAGLEEKQEKFDQAVAGLLLTGFVVGVLSYLYLQLIVLAILKAIGQ